MFGYIFRLRIGIFSARMLRGGLSKLKDITRQILRGGARLAGSIISMDSVSGAMDRRLKLGLGSLE